MKIVDMLYAEITKVGIMPAIQTLHPADLIDLHRYFCAGPDAVTGTSDMEAELFSAVAPLYPYRPACECSGRYVNIDAAALAVESSLRWGKVAKGEKVTVSIEIQYVAALRDAVVAGVEYWNSAAENNFLVLNDPLTKRGDIHLTVGYIDGPGRTLGITYMPRTGTEMDVAWWAGDMILDTDALHWSKGMLNTVLAHELGHAIGMSHSGDRKSIMYPSYRGVRTTASEVDKKEISDHYAAAESDSAHCA